MNERQYKDVAGNPCTLRWLVKNEPEWAENQIRHRDTLESELADASQVIGALTAKLDRANARITKLEEVLSKLVAMDKEHDRRQEDGDSDCAYRAFVKGKTPTWNEARNLLEAKP